MAIPTRKGVHFNGPVKNKVKTAGDRAFFSDLPSGEGPELCVYFNDFISSQDYAAADWTITTTEAGAGAATEALAADEKYGALLITNDDANDDVDSLQMNEENWIMESGKQVWFETRLKIGDVDEADSFIGLAITDTTPRDASDKVGFALTDGSAALSCVTTKNTTSTTSAAITTLADATYVQLGFHWNGVNKVEFFVNRALVATHTANICDDENLAVTFNIQNGTAAANTLAVDYIYVAQER